MNNDELHGKLENLKGRAKDAAGAVTGNKQKQAEGMAERVAGAVREKVGKAKGEIKRKLDDEDSGEHVDDDADE